MCLPALLLRHRHLSQVSAPSFASRASFPARVSPVFPAASVPFSAAASCRVSREVCAARLPRRCFPAHSARRGLRNTRKSPAAGVITSVRALIPYASRSAVPLAAMSHEAAAGFAAVPRFSRAPFPPPVCVLCVSRPHPFRYTPSRLPLFPHRLPVSRLRTSPFPHIRPVFPVRAYSSPRRHEGGFPRLPSRKTGGTRYENEMKRTGNAKDAGWNGTDAAGKRGRHWAEAGTARTAGKPGRTAAAGCPDARTAKPRKRRFLRTLRHARRRAGKRPARRSAFKRQAGDLGLMTVFNAPVRNSWIAGTLRCWLCFPACP